MRMDANSKTAKDSQGLSNRGRPSRGPCWVECTLPKWEQLDDSDVEQVLHEVKKLDIAGHSPNHKSWGLMHQYGIAPPYARLILPEGTPFRREVRV